MADYCAFFKAVSSPLSKLQFTTLIRLVKETTQKNIARQNCNFNGSYGIWKSFKTGLGFLSFFFSSYDFSKPTDFKQFIVIVGKPNLVHMLSTVITRGFFSFFQISICGTHSGDFKFGPCKIMGIPLEISRVSCPVFSQTSRHRFE